MRELGFSVFLGGRNNKLNQEAQAISGCEALPMDVSSIESVRDAVVRVRPDILIHAAATKFVDLAEKFPLECVDINVVGSQNVARVAIDRGVGVVLGISTDKASPPIRNLYGLSKSVMDGPSATSTAPGPLGSPASVAASPGRPARCSPSGRRCSATAGWSARCPRCVASSSRSTMP